MGVSEEVAALAALVASQRADDQRALELQHGEMLRRLDGLNHAHEKAIEVQHTYVTAAKYEDFVRTNAAQRDAEFARVDERIVATNVALEGKLSLLTVEVQALKEWKARASVLAVPITLFASAVGAAVMRAITGG